MDEAWTRVALVAGALLVAGLVALWQRNQTRRPVRDLDHVTLDQGVYFFSSAACPTCARARSKLDESLGEDGYREFAWEQHPGVFADHLVEAVPAVLVVGPEGSGRLYSGQPGRALAEL